MRAGSGSRGSASLAADGFLSQGVAAGHRADVHRRMGGGARLRGKCIPAAEKERKRVRQLAFSAWTSALGLVTMLGVADATDDPIMHPQKDLLKTLTAVFDAAM